MNIGIDFGGVLSMKDKEGTEDKQEGLGLVQEHKNTCIDMPGAIEALHQLKAQGHNLILISFCGKKRALETKQSLEDSGLAALFSALVFVKKPQFKKNICELYQCRYLIDDRADILAHVATAETVQPILFGDGVDWPQIVARIGADFAQIKADVAAFEAPTETTLISRILSYVSDPVIPPPSALQPFIQAF